MTALTLTLFSLVYFLSSPAVGLSIAPRGGNVLYEKTGVEATAYYDIRQTATHDLCGRIAGNEGAPFPAMWSETTGVTDSLAKCESLMPGGTAPTYREMNSDRIVAIDANMLGGDLSAWCGKAVKIFKNGKEFQLDEGPFVIWDGCAACAGGGIIDMSAQAVAGLSDDGKCRDNPSGLTYQVIDNQVWQLATADGTWRPSGANGDDGDDGSALQPVSATPTTLQQATASAAVPASTLVASIAVTTTATGGSSACSIKGAWNCDGLALQMCDYVGTDLGWKVLNPACATYCDISRQPNCG